MRNKSDRFYAIRFNVPQFIYLNVHRFIFIFFYSLCILRNLTILPATLLQGVVFKTAKACNNHTAWQ